MGTCGAGEFVSVAGPTGRGKSTFLKAAAGLLAPSSGTVRVFDERLSGINDILEGGEGGRHLRCLDTFTL
jgi:ABC-type nitrate/sulfonate/bicarbonate transport system ATPase subunit